MHLMFINQIKHQESVTANLHQLASNPIPILPIPALWFRISWEDSIIMPLINGYIKVYTPDYRLESTYQYVTDLD